MVCLNGTRKCETPSGTPTQAGRAGTGFTLVELLVVIGIVALLIAMLFPALARAREAARTVACASNIRQIGISTFAYAARNDGYFPVPVIGAGLVGGLPESAIFGGSVPGILDFTQGTLIPDLGGPYAAAEVFKCPSDESPAAKGMNITLTGSSPNWIVVSRTVVLIPRNFSYVFNPSVVGENKARGVWRSKRTTQARRSARKAVLFENENSPALNHLPVVYDFQTYGEVAHLIIATRHHGRSNVFYADGHVELFDSVSLRDESVKTIFDNPIWAEYFSAESD
jgi:prepilin-type processing-associated H-X9-DG protein/prepilin-type N-terminal cleavage/methylation domain-containing protein